MAKATNLLLRVNYDWGFNSSGGLEELLPTLFLACDNPTIQLWSTLWLTEKYNCCSPNAQFCMFGGTCDMPFEQVAAPHQCIFIRSDTTPPRYDNFNYLHIRLHGLTPFHVVRNATCLRVTLCTWRPGASSLVKVGRWPAIACRGALSPPSSPKCCAPPLATTSTTSSTPSVLKTSPP